MVWLIHSDEELLAAKRNRLAVNRTFSGRSFAGCLPFFRVGQGGVSEKQEASAEEADDECELGCLRIAIVVRIPDYYDSYDK